MNEAQCIRPKQIVACLPVISSTLSPPYENPTTRKRVLLVNIHVPCRRFPVFISTILLPVRSLLPLPRLLNQLASVLRRRLLGFDSTGIVVVIFPVLFNLVGPWCRERLEEGLGNVRC